MRKSTARRPRTYRSVRCASRKPANVSQVRFEHPSYGAEFEEICTDLVKRGPALGIFLLLATQRPDAKAIPTGISANAVLRMCLKGTAGPTAPKTSDSACWFSWPRSPACDGVKSPR